MTPPNSAASVTIRPAHARGLRRWIHPFVRLVQIQSAFRPYLKRRRSALFLTIVLSTLYAAARLLEPWPLQVVFDQAVLGRNTRFLGVDFLALVGGDRTLLVFYSALAVLVLALVAGTLYYAQSVLLARAGQEMVRELREDVFHQLLRLSLSFHRRHSTGDLIMRLTGDMILLRDTITASLVTLTSELFLLVSVVALMFAVSVHLTLATLVLAPAIYILFGWFRQRMIQAARKQRHREGRLAATLGDTLLAIPMVQAFTAETREEERFRQISKRSQRAGLRAARLEAGMQRLVDVLLAIGTCLVLWLGVREILSARLTPGVFLVFLAYLRTLYKPVRKLSKVAERTSRASAAVERVREILDARREIKDSKSATPAPALRGAIRFSDVSFSYEAGVLALEKLSFSISPGEKVALVGPSGAGKSTLFSLLLRFHDPTEGRIYLDDENLKRYTLASVRRQIGFLTQDPFIVGGTIRENLLYGRPEASDVELWDALCVAGLEELVRGLPNGLDTPVSPRGDSLSGGEKQRLAIARVVLKDSPILLLDEPTTGLDARTEQEVLAQIDRLSRGRTTIVIAHRLSTVRSADRVLVLDRGRLVEEGSPEDLLARDTLFRYFAEIQQSDQPATVPGGPQAPARRPDGGPPPETSELPLEGNVQGLLPDPAVRGVERLRERGLAKLLRDLPEGIRVDPAAAFAVTLKQRPGQRAVIRIEPREPGAFSPLFVKLTRTRHGNEQFRILDGVREAALSAGVHVPRPLAWLPRYRALVLGHCSGVPLLESAASHLADPPRDGLEPATPSQAPPVLAELGAALAQIHGSAPAPERLADVSTELDRLVLMLERLAPGDHDGFTKDVESVRDRTPAQPAGRVRDWIVLHGDFHPAQVLYEKRVTCHRLSLLDWDEITRGDAERDLGNFEAHLHLEVARGRLDLARAQAYGEALERGYLSVRHLDLELLAWYRAASLLRLAILHVDPGFGAAPPNPHELAIRLRERARTELAMVGGGDRPKARPRPREHPEDIKAGRE